MHRRLNFLLLLLLLSAPGVPLEASGFGICGHIPNSVELDAIKEAGVKWVQIEKDGAFVVSKPASLILAEDLDPREGQGRAAR